MISEAPCLDRVFVRMYRISHCLFELNGTLLILFLGSGWLVSEFADTLLRVLRRCSVREDVRDAMLWTETCIRYACLTSQCLEH